MLKYWISLVKAPKKDIFVEGPEKYLSTAPCHQLGGLQMQM